MILAPALAVALVAAVSACTGSGSSPSSSAQGSSAPAATDTAAAVTQITADWKKVFNASTPPSRKAALVQNGSTFATAIDASLKWPSELASGVTDVRLNSAASATVTYTVSVSGHSDPALSGLTGTAVYQNGLWKVSDVSLCALLKLVPGGPAPSACSSAG
jgi:hypothetical protein